VFRHLFAIIDLFRLPLIDGIEDDYINAADTPAEAVRRRKQVAGGFFRGSSFDM